MKILENNVVTLFIFFVVAVVTFFISSKNIIQDVSNYDRKPLDINDIKTGDMFLISYTGHYASVVKTIAGFNFIHPSIAVWENGELWMVEFAYYTEDKKGLIKIAFSDWIKYNRNTVILKNTLSIKNDSSKEREILRQNILNFYEKYKKKYSNFSNFLNPNYFRFLNKFGKYDSITETSNVTCAEIMAFLVHETEISQKTKPISFFQSSKFVGFDGFDLQEKYYCDENYILEL